MLFRSRERQSVSGGGAERETHTQNLKPDVLTAQSLEPASNSVSPSLSLLLPHSHSVSLSKINLKKKLKKILNQESFNDTLLLVDNGERYWESFSRTI